MLLLLPPAAAMLRQFRDADADAAIARRAFSALPPIFSAALCPRCWLFSPLLRSVFAPRAAASVMPLRHACRHAAALSPPPHARCHSPRLVFAAFHALLLFIRYYAAAPFAMPLRFFHCFAIYALRQFSRHSRRLQAITFAHAIAFMFAAPASRHAASSSAAMS